MIPAGFLISATCATAWPVSAARLSPGAAEAGDGQVTIVRGVCDRVDLDRRPQVAHQQVALLGRVSRLVMEHVPISYSTRGPSLGW